MTSIKFGSFLNIMLAVLVNLKHGLSINKTVGVEYQVIWVCCFLQKGIYIHFPRLFAVLMLELHCNGSGGNSKKSKHRLSYALCIDSLVQGWANFLAEGPHRPLKSGRGPGLVVLYSCMLKKKLH